MAIEIFLGKPPTHIENWIKNNGTYNVTITNNTDNNTLYGRFERTRYDQGNIQLQPASTGSNVISVQSRDMGAVEFNVAANYEVKYMFEGSYDESDWTTQIEFNPQQTNCSITSIRYIGESGCGGSGCAW